MAMGVVIRMLVLCLLSTIMVLYYPWIWLRVVAPLAGFFADAACPYINELKATNDGLLIRLHGQFHIALTRADGTSLPPAILDWHKHSMQTLIMLVVAVSVWAAPAVTFKRRMLVFPVMLLALALACAYDLAVETQLAALHMIGTEWLPGIPMLNSDANADAFSRMENWYQSLKWVKAFNDAGGRLFLAALAGLIGYTRPFGMFSQSKN